MKKKLIDQFRDLELDGIITVKGKKDTIRQTGNKVQIQTGHKFTINVVEEKEVIAKIKRTE